MAGQESERQKQRQSLPPRFGESWESCTIAQKGVDNHTQSRTFAKAGAAEQEKAISGRQSSRKCDLRPNFPPAKSSSWRTLASVLVIAFLPSVLSLSLFDDGFDKFDSRFHIAIEDRHWWDRAA